MWYIYGGIYIYCSGNNSSFCNGVQCMFQAGTCIENFESEKNDKECLRHILSKIFFLNLALKRSKSKS